MLDIRTLFVMLALSAVLMALTLWIGTRGARGGGIGKWNLSLGLIAFGWMLVLGRERFSELVTVALADALLLAGLCLQAAALLEFRGRAAPRWLVYAPGPLLFALIVPLLGDFASVTLLVSVACAGVWIGSAWLALQLAYRARTIMAATFVLGAVALLVRAVAVWLGPESYPGIFAGNALQAVTFVTLFAMIIVNAFAFLIMQRELAEAEMRRLAMFDPLTELFNRRAFLELAERERSRSRRAGTPIAALMLDLDHFKRVNDTLGHPMGDRVLAEFAGRLKECVRHEDLAARYGGEEFCVLMPGAGLESALAVAERIRTAAAVRPLGGIAWAVTVSIGAAACSRDCVIDALIVRADEALYQAKAAGRNRVVGLGAGREIDARQTAEAVA